MSYHLKSTRRPPRAKRFIWILLFILIFLLGVLPGFLFSVSTIFAKGSLSFKERILSGYDISSSYFTTRNELVDQNERLLDIVSQIDGYKNHNQILIDENEALKNIRDGIDGQDIIANVVTLPPQTAFDIMVIESSEHVNIGNKVLSESGVLIGEVVETRKNISKVKLLSSPRNTFFVENARTGERYELVGRSVGNYSTSLPKESDIKTDDVLIIRSEIMVSPVAKVGAVEIRESSPFLTAYAVSPVSIFSLQHVVIKKENETQE
jgi:cell shape-determining protein MreC